MAPALATLFHEGWALMEGTAVAISAGPRASDVCLGPRA